ncbi:MAG: hypothetical protein QG646_436 [Euryarchaeota archaeon]|nr:hypothetical protein [Euryarchaeota archaeon]
MSENEMLGVFLPKEDKEEIKEIARKNKLSISSVARMLICDSLEHLGESELLKLMK